MVHRFYLPFFLLFLLACGKEKEKTTDPDLSLQGITDADFVTLPIEAQTFDVSVSFVNFSSTQRAKMEDAIEILKLVIGTDEFKNRVLNHTYNGQKTFVDNNGFTNAQIYKIILNGAEKLRPSKNNTLDADVELYYASNNVVGYTYPSTTRIWVNTKYFNSYTSAGVAHNLFHEWMHKLGFNHSSEWNTARDYSVPYALGRIVGEIGRDFL